VRDRSFTSLRGTFGDRREPNVTKQSQLVVLALACLLPFIRLGLGEILPWDESLYAIRADACLKFGAWLDQTQYAVGHLYSSTHPPLGVWLIAISKYCFGDSTFAVRLPIALAASASVFLLWLTIRKMVSENAALVAAVSLSTADLFLVLSHRAQMECLLLFFCVAAIYSFVLAIEEERWPYALMSGILLGLGLLTKFGEALFILPFLLLLPWALGKPRSIRYVGIIIPTSIVIAVPWFLMMTLRHPDYWTHVFGSLEILREGNYAPSTLAWWYYLNQLLVALPLIVVAFCIRGASRLFRASLVWLISLLIVLQLVGTRMPHFAFLLIVPGVFLIASSWDALADMHPKKRRIMFILILLAVAWSASEQIRLLVTHRMVWDEVQIPLIGIVTVVIALATAAYFWRSRQGRSKYAIVISTILLGIALANLFSEDESESIHGASLIMTVLSANLAKSDLVVIHSDFPSEQYAPQLAYYSKGWTLGWIPGKTSRAISWDSAATSAYTPDSSHEIAVITRFEDRFYHRPASETALWDTLTRKLRKSFSHEQVYRSYVLYY
jgi:4-amino-4-deoxy-L-arabinose transferase-like glycosyltransferase